MENSRTPWLSTTCLVSSHNVSAALDHLRHPDERPYLWVDALCINQADDVEKSAQVQEMLSIYKKASKVVAWIGEKKNSGFNAIDYLNEAPSETNHSKDCVPGLQKMHTDI